MKNKEKQSAYYREWSKRNKEKIAAYKRSWGETNRDRLAKRTQAYYASHKEEVLAMKAKWISANPDKHAAHVAIRVALGNGDIMRPTACSMCGKPCTPHGHHPDYSKRLEVVWMCAICHKKEHRREAP